MSRTAGRNPLRGAGVRKSGRGVGRVTWVMATRRRGNHIGVGYSALRPSGIVLT